MEKSEACQAMTIYVLDAYNESTGLLMGCLRRRSYAAFFPHPHEQRSRDKETDLPTDAFRPGAAAVASHGMGKVQLTRGAVIAGRPPKLGPNFRQ